MGMKMIGVEEAETPESASYRKLAEAVDEVRENTAALVAGLMQDGFDEEQARIITTGLFGQMAYRNTKGEN